MSLGYRKDIDGLRSIAVLSVVLYHLGIDWIPGGFVGVDIFFVISGYLITGIIVREVTERRFTLWEFYSRRIRRIFPALFLVLFCSAIAGVLILMPNDYQLFFKALKYASQQLSNFLFARGVDYFAVNHAPSPVLHTWSLAVEEQFYLFWPLLILLVARFLSLSKLPALLFGVFVLSLINSEWLMSSNPKQAFYFLNSRAWELALGGLIAVNALPAIRSQVARNSMSVAGLVMIGLAVFYYDKTTRFPGVSALLPCVGSALLIYSGQYATSAVHRLLSMAPFVFVGLISYSLYLWHWPIIVFTEVYQQAPLAGLQPLWIFLAAVAASYLSWRFVEKPFRRGNILAGLFKRNLASSELSSKGSHAAGNNQARNAVLIGLACIAIFTVAANLMREQSHAPWRFNTNVLPHYSAWDDYLLDCNYGGRHMRRDELPDGGLCTQGDDGDNYQAVLFGDSHAAHYFAAVSEWAKSQGLGVRLLGSLGCPALLGDFDMTKPEVGVVSKCRGFSDAVEQLLVDNEQIKYVFLAMRMDLYTHFDGVRLVDGIDTSRDLANSQRVFAKNLEYTLKLLAEHGKQVILLGQVPLLANDPVGCHLNAKVLLSKWLPIREDRDDCFRFDNQLYEENLKFVFSVLDQLKNKYAFYYFDPVIHFDSAVADGYILYRDADHLNEKGSRYLGRFIQLPVSVDDKYR